MYLVCVIAKSFLEQRYYYHAIWYVVRIVDVSYIHTTFEECNAYEFRKSPEAPAKFLEQHIWLKSGESALFLSNNIL